LSFAIACLIFAGLATPAVAQFEGPASSEFTKAVHSRNGDKATALLRDHPTIVDARDDDGNTGLIVAIARQDADWTGFLLGKGADPNLAGKGGDTPLITAARNGFEDAAGWLVAEGAKVDTPNRMGETALIVAVQQRQIHIVKLLLGAGANPDKADSAAGLSARDYAVRDTRSRQILQLIEAKKPKASTAR
jgi:ankyrin repeat protein